MIELMLPPFLLLLFGALTVYKLERKQGFAIAAFTTLAPLIMVLTLQQDQYYQNKLFGQFDVILLNIDQFTSIIGATFSILAFSAVLYGYSSDLPRKTASIAMLYMASTFGVIFSGDWLTLLFFAELMAVTSTLLIWFYGGEAVKAGFRYAIAHGTAGALLFLGVAWHYVVESTFIFDETGIAQGIPAVIMLLGIGINCGFIGFHMWLPDSYPKPHFASSVFLSVFTTKTSAYILYRIQPEGFMALSVAYMGGLMAVYGVFFALMQHDMRALLSYHIQAQMGYMIAGIGLGLYLGGGILQIGVGGAIAHLINNILFKSLLFMAVGVVIYRTGVNNLYKLGGLYKVMPFTAFAFLLGALSITAVPGFNGFISKGLILDAANPSYFGGGNTYIYWLLKAGAIGTFLSFIKLGYYVFLHKPETKINVKDAKTIQKISMLGIGLTCLLIGVFWNSFVQQLPLISAQLALQPYSLSHLQDALLLGLTSLIVFKLVRKPLKKHGHLQDIDKVLYPAIYKSTQLTAEIVAKIYGKVDDFVVKSVKSGYKVGSSPENFSDFVTEIKRKFESNEESEEIDNIEIRTSIGTTILIIMAVLTLVLYFI